MGKVHAPLDRKGQSTIEYILLFTAVILVMISLVVGKITFFRGVVKDVQLSPYQGKINEVYDRGATETSGASNRLFSSFKTIPAPVP
jgi:hypothetical protein